jgi:hypothetical protein
VNANGAGVKSLKEADGTTNPASIPTTEDSEFRYDGTVFRKVNAVRRSGDSVQVVNTQTGALATGTTILPYDDTIPQNTEGDQYMSLSITPTNANNKLLIEVVALASTNITANGEMTAALFQDSIVNALAAISGYSLDNETPINFKFSHYMTAGSISPITFKVRIGSGAANTTTFNGVAGGRKLGGVSSSSITITEIQA